MAERRGATVALPHRGRLIVFKRIVASVFVAVVAVVGVSAPAANASTSTAASFKIDWE